MKKTGFTLIELLIVIAIIGLLLAVVIPSLYKARGRVQTVTCQSNLKQWGIYFRVYSDDNDGFLPSSSRDWVTALQPYSGSPSYAVKSAQEASFPGDGRNSLSCCPLAAEPENGINGQPFVAYTIQNPYSSEPMAVGSYGINGWACNVPPSETEIYGISTRNNWRNFDLADTASKIPLILDSMWMRAYPDNTNLPPDENGDFDGCDLTGGGRRQMRHFCIDRHDGGTNGIFMDLSVRRVGLKELWKLKWHRSSDQNASTPNWPEWMRDFREY